MHHEPPFNRRAQSNKRRLATLFIAIASTACSLAHAKPIAFADGWTFMHERDSNMIQTEFFYAPKYWFSFGPTTSIMKSDDHLNQMTTTLAQANYLVRRWNLPGAQANIFASYGIGKSLTTQWRANSANGVNSPLTKQDFNETAQRFVLQGDFETRQFYASIKADRYQTPLFLDRIDTAQIGVSPYAHDYDDLAIWFVAQVKKYRGVHFSQPDKTEGGAFVRLFRKNIWVELGVNERRKSQMMLMINY